MGLTYKFDLTQPNKYDREGKLVNPDASRVFVTWLIKETYWFESDIPCRD